MTEPEQTDEAELLDDALAELLADRLVELVTGPDADPVTTRRITNALRLDAGLEPYPWEIGRRAVAVHLRMSVRSVREIEAVAMERLRNRLLPLLEALKSQQPTTPEP